MHAIPFQVGFKFIIFPIFVLLLCSFVIRVSQNEQLWWQVINYIDMSQFILIIAWVMVAVCVYFIAIGITILITKDKKTIKTD